MHVHYDEGIAPGRARLSARAGPKHRQGRAPRKFADPAADAVQMVEGDAAGRDIANARLVRLGPRPWHVA